VSKRVVELYQMGHKKKEKLEILTKKVSKEQGLTFQPQIKKQTPAQLKKQNSF